MSKNIMEVIQEVLNSGKDFRVVGIDVGNGQIKGYTNKPLKGQMSRQIVMPNTLSVKDKASEKQFDFSTDIAGVSTYETASKPNQKFFWGEGIHKIDSKNRLTSFGVGDKKGNLAFEVLSEIALSELVENGDKVIVVAGTPSDRIQYGAGEIRDIFNGQKIITKDGEEKFFEVVATIVIPQPLGTYYYKQLNDLANIKDEEIEEEVVGVWDFGNGTFDMSTINYGSISMETGDSVTIQGYGGIEIWTELGEYIVEQSKGRIRTLHWSDVERYTKDGVFSKGAFSGNNAIDVKDEMARIVKKKFEELVGKIEENWQDLSVFNKILVTGGASNFFNQLIIESKLNINQNVYLVDEKETQTANSIGFMRFGLFTIEAIKESLED